MKTAKLLRGNMLVAPKRGKYSLTLLGKIVYDAHPNIGKALSYYWKHKAIT
jgi:predicted transcriptional regulator